MSCRSPRGARACQDFVLPCSRVEGWDLGHLGGVLAIDPNPGSKIPLIWIKHEGLKSFSLDEPAALWALSRHV